MRITAFALTLLVGVALVLIGFFLSAPIGPTTSPVYSNPRMVFAPGLFVIGLILIFVSAVVYELTPDRRS